MKIRRIIAAILVLAIMICALPAFAETETKYSVMYVGKTTMNVYKKASTSSERMGMFSYGDTIWVVQKNSKWAQITNASGAIGYCLVSYLTGKDPAVSPVMCYSTTNELTVYQKASTDSKVLGRLDYNDGVKGVAITPDKKFLRFEWDGSYAFAEMKYFSLEAAGETKTVYITKTTAALRKTKSDSAAKMGTAYFGEEFSMTRLEGKWAYISNGIVSGWCSTSALSYDDCAGSEKHYTAKKSGIKVYARSGKMLAEIDTLDSGEEVIVVAFTTDKVYAMVEHEDTYAYVQSAYLAAGTNDGKTEETEETTVYVTENNVTAYKEPSSSAKKAGTVSFGEVLTCIQISGDWALVKNSVGQGWVKKSTLSEENPCKLDKTGYVSAKKATVYQRPMTNAKVLGSLKLNAEVEIVGKTEDGEWYRIKHSSGYGFVKVSEVSDKKSETVSSITVYVTANNATAYKKPSASASKAGTVSFGEVLTCTEVSGDWALVKNSVGQGWVKKSALSTTNPCTSSGNLYVKSATASVYQRPGTSYKKLGTLTMNTEVVSVGRTKDKEWYRVEYDGGYGFVRASDMTSSKPESGVTVYVRYNVVEAYETSSSSSKKIGEAYYGQKLTRLSVSREWALVTNGSTQGWVKLDALTSTDPNGSGKAMYAAADSVVVRKKPDANGAKLTTLAKGDIAVVVAVTPDGEWARIKYNSGYAFIAVKDLTSTSPHAYDDPYAGTSGNDSIERVISLAIAQYGKPYVYAEEGPDSYDCSGLVQYCFQKITGIKLRRTGHDQGYDERFPRVESVDALKRGDVVVFDTIEDGDDYSDHTGIYLGGGMFIHASSGAGKVIVSNLSSGYYNRKFSWGLRVVD